MDSDPSFVQPVASRYTDCVTAALTYSICVHINIYIHTLVHMHSCTHETNACLHEQHFGLPPRRWLLHYHAVSCTGIIPAKEVSRGTWKVCVDPGSQEHRQGASAPPENELHVETNVIWMQGAYRAETCWAGVLVLPSNWTGLSHTWNESNLPDKEYLELLSREICRFVGSIQTSIFPFWNKTKIGNVEVGVRNN
jgi:hypothetical protein